jgi:hypothetical protein
MRAAILSFLLVVPLWAGNKVPPHPAILQARTFAIVNETGSSSDGDDVYKIMRKWKQCHYVSDPKGADIVLIISENSPEYLGSTQGGVYVSQRTTVETGQTQSNNPYYFPPPQRNNNADTLAQIAAMPRPIYSSGHTFLTVQDGKTTKPLWQASSHWSNGRHHARKLTEDLLDRIRHAERNR